MYGFQKCEGGQKFWSLNCFYKFYSFSPDRNLNHGQIHQNNKVIDVNV